MLIYTENLLRYFKTVIVTDCVTNVITFDLILHGLSPLSLSLCI